MNNEIRDREAYRDRAFVRFAPIKEGEVVYAVGWGIKQHNNAYPALTKLKCYRPVGTYYYVQSLTEDARPEGTSGSPVIDKNGYLVGIASGAEGNLGIIGGTGYLRKLLDKYGIKYKSDID